MLREYGIHTEDSDIRAHVSVVNRTIYIFPTRNGIETILRDNPREATATQPGVDGITASGWIVPVVTIHDMRRVAMPKWKRWEAVRESMTTTEKGAFAIRCVLLAMKHGRFPFWIDATEDERETTQVAGTDIIVYCQKRVQVKCDFRAGDKPAGTGNLFLQKSERNPLSRH